MASAFQLKKFSTFQNIKRVVSLEGTSGWDRKSDTAAKRLTNMVKNDDHTPVKIGRGNGKNDHKQENIFL